MESTPMGLFGGILAGAVVGAILCWFVIGPLFYRLLYIQPGELEAECERLRLISPDSDWIPRE